MLTLLYSFNKGGCKRPTREVLRPVNGRSVEKVEQVKFKINVLSIIIRVFSNAYTDVSGSLPSKLFFGT